MPDVSPTKWHRAHVTWFFETFVLAEHEQGFAPFQDQYWFLFNSYYESLGPRYARPDRGLVTRPGAHDVGVYRGNVDDRMRDLVAGLDDGTLEKLTADHRARLPPRAAAPGAAPHGHQARAVAQPARPGLRRHPARARASPTPLGWVDVEGGLVEVGHEGDGLLLRQRAAPAPAVARALPPRRPPRHQRRVARVHGRRRVPAPRAVALRRLGQGAAPTAGEPRSTGPSTTASGSSTPCTAPGRSTPACR